MESELKYVIDSIQGVSFNGGGQGALFQLRTRDEDTIRALERYNHRLSTDGYMYYFQIAVRFDQFKNLDPAMFNDIKKADPELIKQFVLARIRGEING